MTHFKGKSVLEHLKETRTKGSFASGEPHGQELSGFGSAFLDTFQESPLLILLYQAVLWHLPYPDHHKILIISVLLVGWALWKGARSACLGFGRLERLGKLLEEEKREITHNRDEERQELTELYRAKGFEGEMLEQVIDVLMSDDNKLLVLMMEEEFGVCLQSIEHPIKQASGALIGVIASALITIPAFWLFSTWGLFVSIGLITVICAAWAHQREKTNFIAMFCWKFAAVLLGYGACYFLTEWLVSIWL